MRIPSGGFIFDFAWSGSVFNIGRSNRLGWVCVVDNDDLDQVIGIWVIGCLLGRYVSFTLPMRRRLRA